MLNNIVNYFSLWTTVAVAGEKGIRKYKQPLILFGVVLGAIGKVAFDAAQGKIKPDWLGLAAAVIAAIVVFPAIYEKAGLAKGKLNLVKWCVAFQNGFFWTVLLEQLGRRLTS